MFWLYAQEYVSRWRLFVQSSWKYWPSSTLVSVAQPCCKFIALASSESSLMELVRLVCCCFISGYDWLWSFNESQFATVGVFIDWSGSWKWPYVELCRVESLTYIQDMSSRSLVLSTWLWVGFFLNTISEALSWWPTAYPNTHAPHAVTLLKRVLLAQSLLSWTIMSSTWQNNSVDIILYTVTSR